MGGRRPRQLLAPGRGGRWRGFVAIVGCLAQRGARGRKHAEFPAGFFVAGSSIDAVNGVYAKAEADQGLPHLFLHTYVNDASSWVLGFVHAAAEGHDYEPVGGLSTEWLFMDDAGRDRLGHVGNCLQPSAGSHWEHVGSRPEYAGRFRAGERVRTRAVAEDLWEAGAAGEVLEVSAGRDVENPIFVQFEDGLRTNTQAWQLQREPAPPAAGEPGEAPREDSARARGELPGRLVAISGNESLRSIRQEIQEFEDRTRQAAQELLKHLPAVPPDGYAGPEHAEDAPPPEAGVAGRCAGGRPGEALGLLETELGRTSDVYGRAALHMQRASCLRLASDPASAMEGINLVLGFFPRHRQAVFERALAWLDMARPVDAVHALELLLSLDPSWPRLEEWLLRAHARARRRGRAPVSGGLYIGDHVKTVADYDEFWSAGEPAVVIGLGVYHAPVLVRLGGGRVINSQSEHFMATARPGGAPAAATQVDDHYSALGLRADFFPDELSQAFREASRRCDDPDLGGSDELHRRVAEAYECLSQPAKRKDYDRGEDLPHVADRVPLHQEVARRYFHRREYEPLGGPGAAGDPADLAATRARGALEA